MRILCQYTDAGPSFVRRGWGHVFAAMQHEFFFWKPEKKPAHDIFNELEPDVFIGTTYDCDRAVANCIARRPQMKVALYASAWGELSDAVDGQKYPIVRATDNEKKAIEQLKKVTGRPDFVFIHVTAKYLEGTMGGWRSIGVKPLGILNAADTFVYLGGKPRDDLLADVGFVGGYWPYKARNLNPYLLPLCHPNSGLDVKIFGNGVWPTHRYLGTCTDQDARDLFASATVCPNVSEPHSTDLGWDVIERPFKVMAAGGFCVSDYVEEARECFTSDELLMERTPKAFEETIRHFVRYPQEREAYIRAGQAAVLSSHTYFNRVAQIFDGLGMCGEAVRCLELRNQLLGLKT